MQFTLLALAAAAATMVSAVPTEQYGFPQGMQGEDYGDHSMDHYCSNDQKAACCNTDENSPAGIPILSNLLGGSCALTVIGGNCRQGSIACCPTQGQQGLINVGSICAPISL